MIFSVSCKKIKNYYHNCIAYTSEGLGLHYLLQFCPPFCKMAFLNGFGRRPSWIHEEIDEYFYLHDIDAYDFISYDINIYWKASSIIAINVSGVQSCLCQTFQLFSVSIICVQSIDVQSMVFANDRIHYGLQVVFVCLQITPSHYHHYADSSQGIDLIKCLSGICCRVCV